MGIDKSGVNMATPGKPKVLLTLTINLFQVVFKPKDSKLISRFRFFWHIDSVDRINRYVELFFNSLSDLYFVCSFIDNKAVLSQIFG